MITATVLGLSPVVVVVGIATRDLRLWWRQLRNIRALPETPPKEVESESAT
jgi:hypothetical protein